jgi:septal ring factor EnvC (AmiA/AmiB activator)
MQAIASLEEVVGKAESAGGEEETAVDENTASAAVGTADPLVKDAVKNLKLDLSRGGRAIKAIHKAMDELLKCARKSTLSAAAAGAVSSLQAEDEVRVSSLEDKVTKALLELHKATERRQALQKKLEAQQVAAEKKEKKRQEAAVEKHEKDALKQKAQAEKAAAESEAAEAKKRAVRVPSEKELKEQAIKQKQQNMLMSFLGKKSAPPGPVLHSEETDAGRQDDVAVLDARQVEVASSAPVTAAAAAASSRQPKSRASRSFDDDAFLVHLLSNKPLASISDDHRHR